MAAAVAVTLALVMAAVPDTGWADTKADVTRAKVHFEAGKGFFDKKMYEEALPHLQKAYELAPTPALIYNIAVCQEELGDHKGALAHYRRYLVSLPFGDKRDAIQAKVDALAKKVGDHGAAGAADPKPAVPAEGDTPKDSTDAKPSEGDAKPSEGDAKPSEGDAKPSEGDAKPPEGDAKPSEGDGALDADGQVVSGSAGSVAEADGRFYTWLAAGATGAFGITALALGLSTNALHGSLKEDCGQTAVGCPDSDIDGVRNRAIATDVMIGLAAGAAVATVVLYFVESKDEQAGSTTTTGAFVAPTQSGAAVGISGAF